MRIDLPNSIQFAKIFKPVLNRPLNAEVTAVVTDSREVQKGDLIAVIHDMERTGRQPLLSQR